MVKDHIAFPLLSAGAATAAQARVGTAEEVAALIVFLAGPQSAQITGAEIRIDGGVVPNV